MAVSAVPAIRKPSSGISNPGQWVILSVKPHAFNPPPAECCRDRVHPGPQVAQAKQIQPMQSQLTADEGQPGGKRFVFWGGLMHAAIIRLEVRAVAACRPRRASSA